MSVSRPTESSFSAKRSWRCGISLAGVLLVMSAFGVASASASLAGHATDAVERVVSPVTGASPPSLPSSPPPQPSGSTPPRSPVKVPAVPPVPSVPPVKAPSATAPDSSHLAPASSGGPTKVSTPGARLPPPGEVTGGASGAGSGSPGEANRVAPSAQGGGDEASGSRGVPRPGAGAGSVESAEPAPLPLLRAYVWPAIALGPAGELVEALLARLEAATSPAVSSLSRLLSGQLGVAGADRAGGPSQSSAVSNPPPKDSRDFPVPSGGQVPLLVFIIGCAALMAWLGFALKREARSTHWPL